MHYLWVIYHVHNSLRGKPTKIPHLKHGQYDHFYDAMYKLTGGLSQVYEDDIRMRTSYIADYIICGLFIKYIAVYRGMHLKNSNS